MSPISLLKIGMFNPRLLCIHIEMYFINLCLLWVGQLLEMCVYETCIYWTNPDNKKLWNRVQLHSRVRSVFLIPFWLSPPSLLSSPFSLSLRVYLLLISPPPPTPQAMSPACASASSARCRTCHQVKCKIPHAPQDPGCGGFFATYDDVERIVILCR
jgi:hypothetical protein